MGGGLIQSWDRAMTEECNCRTWDFLPLRVQVAECIEVVKSYWVIRGECMAKDLLAQKIDQV
jgi:hypothetical protein